MRSLFPELQPRVTGMLLVGNGHELYYEEAGNPQGKPALYLHGGPGAGCSGQQRRYHDPAAYRIVLFDQRGCGKSRPLGMLEGNDTWALVQDIEALREHLKVDRWQVMGGSWGTTLALAYAISHPSRVTEIILRGVFLFTTAELEYIYSEQATALIYPEEYAALQSHVPAAERGNLVSAFRKRIMSDDESTRVSAARAWGAWEDAISTLRPSGVQDTRTDEEAVAETRIHLHYMWNRGFFAHDGWLLDHVHEIAHLPVRIVHGRYDVVCPPAAAWRLHQKLLDTSTLTFVPDAGHSGFEPATVDALVSATEEFKA
mmetsp:Transcript_26097/g.57170  ORF Transcript_26097/g.57170 Transcript_26097/m.57170 type:complete len:315 (-) Transcript_26097:23-967(-)